MLIHNIQEKSRTFYKYYNEDSDSIQWLNIPPEECISGLIFMDEFEVFNEDVQPEWCYKTFMRNLLNTNTY